MRDALLRRSFERGAGMPREPMSVWSENDQTTLLTELDPSHLPKWDDLTEFMKMFIGYDIGMEFGRSYSFTARITPILLNRWKTKGADLMENVEQRLRRDLGKLGMRGLAFCYAVETRTRSGRSATQPHLHGYCICDNPVDSTRFKVALERALYLGVSRVGKRSTVQVKPSFDFMDEFIGRAHWLEYRTKNIDRWNVLLGKRRIFMSRPLLGMVREAWEIRSAE